MRTLIADVTLLPAPDFTSTRIGIRWHTGACDELVVARRMRVYEYRRTDPAAVELAQQLAHLSNRDIAERLCTAGYKTGVGRGFDADAVANLRQSHHIPAATLLEEGELTVSEVARRLGIGQGAVIHWINRGWLPARRGLNDRWCIPFDPAVETECRDRVARSVHIPRPDSTEPPDDNELTVAEVAAVLDISTNVVYYWIEHHHVRARRGPGGRWFIDFDADAEVACRRWVATSVHIKADLQSQTARLILG